MSWNCKKCGQTNVDWSNTCGRCDADESGVAKVTIVLAEGEAALLVNALQNHQDCGPAGEGWKSPELEALLSKIENQIR
jgi:hypothetical protein